jgi:WD40 repeat protein
MRIAFILSRFLPDQTPLPTSASSSFRLLPFAFCLLLTLFPAVVSSQGKTTAAPPLKPPLYNAPPVVVALAFSPDGNTLAVAGYREVLLHKADGSGLVARLVGKSERIESLAFSPDGKILAAVGGAASRFGEVQFWNTADNTLINAVEISKDSLFGVAFSPDGKSLSFGGADNAIRIVSVPEGKPLMKFDNHSDWTFATTWATDNKHLLSTGRDRAIKLIVAANGSFVDDINTHTSPYRAMARHPKADQVLAAGDDGVPRLYQVFRTKPRTMNQEDHNLLRVYEKQPAQVNALAFSSDGTMLAVGGESGVVNVYMTDNGKPPAPDQPVVGGKPIAMLRGQQGVVHTIAFHPDGKKIAVSGFDGTVRLYELPSGKLLTAFVPVPLTKPSASRAAAGGK